MCTESSKVDLEDGRKIVFLSTHGKNESEVPKELVIFLKYVKEDLEGSEKEFHDSYVEQLQKSICKIKGNREMEERLMIFEEMLKEEYVAGQTEDRKETLLLFLRNLGTVPEELCSRIQNQQDLEVLNGHNLHFSQNL